MVSVCDVVCVTRRVLVILGTWWFSGFYYVWLFALFWYFSVVSLLCGLCLCAWVGVAVVGCVCVLGGWYGQDLMVSVGLF